jgi:transposase
MGEVTTIGLDLAKHVFQVHGIDAAGQVMVRRQLRRGELLKFFEKQSPCWLVWKLAAPRITGRVRSRRLGIR